MSIRDKFSEASLEVLDPLVEDMLGESLYFNGRSYHMISEEYALACVVEFLRQLDSGPVDDDVEETLLQIREDLGLG